MALVKILKGGSGKPGQVETTDIVNQNTTGRVYTPAGPAVTLTAEPNHQWLFNDAATQITDTTIGTAFDITANPGANAESVAELMSNAFSFDKGNTEYYSSTGNATQLTPSGDISWGVWVKPSTLTTLGVIWTVKGTSGNFSWQMYVDTDGSTVVHLSQDGTSLAILVSAASKVTTTAWAFIGFSYDSATGDIKSYVNNEEVASDTSTFSAGDVHNATAKVFVGADRLGGNLYDGLMDAAYFTNNLWTLADFTAIYQGGSPTVENLQGLTGVTLSALPVHQWLMNDGTADTSDMTQLTDTTTGTPFNITSKTGSPLARDSLVNQGIEFDSGNTETFDVAGGQTVVPAAGSFSWAGWVKPETITGSHILMSTTHDSPDFGMTVSIGSSLFRFDVSLNGTSFESFPASTIGEVVNGEWNLVACTHTSGELKVYVYSSAFTGLSDTQAIGAGPIFRSGAQKLNVAADRNDSQKYDGIIDAMYIWHDLLDDTDFSAIYQNGNPTIENLQTAIAGPPANGDTVYLNASGAAAPALADSFSTSKAIGFYENTDDSVQSQRGQEITGFTVEGGALAAGDTVYLSDATAGAVTKTAPSASGSQVVKLGEMESATKLILDIKFLYAID